MTLKVPLTAFGRPLAGHHRCFWRIARAVARLLGAQPPTGMEAIPPTGPAVVVAPHTSFLDALFLFAALPRPSRFLAAAFFAGKNAPVSWLLFWAGVIPVRRSRADPMAIRQALRLLARGEMMVIFPEGGRTWTGVPTLPMTPAVKFLLGLRVPIYLAAVDGAFDYWPRFAPFPVPRRVRVRLVEVLALSRGRRSPGRPEGAGGGAWWSSVYGPGRRAEVRGAAEEIRSKLAAAAAGETDRLRLEAAGRLAALPGVLCFCPECGGGALALRGRSLVCPSCGTALRPAGRGRLRRIPPGGRAEADLTLHDLFSRMVARVEQRARNGFCLEESVEAGIVGQDAANAAGIPFVPARAALDGGGLRLAVGGRDIHVPLTAVAACSMMGSETLEIPHREAGTVVYVRAPAAALRILLAARAFLGLPFDSINP